MKAMTNSEVAQLVATKFPKLNRYAKTFDVYDFSTASHSCLTVQETKTGYSSLRIYNKYYTKMTATEKREAVEFINNLDVEIITTKDKFGFYHFYGIRGTYMNYINSLDDYHKRVYLEEIVSIE